MRPISDRTVIAEASPDVDRGTVKFCFKPVGDADTEQLIRKMYFCDLCRSFSSGGTGGRDIKVQIDFEFHIHFKQQLKQVILYGGDKQLRAEVGYRSFPVFALRILCEDYIIRKKGRACFKKSVLPLRLLLKPKFSVREEFIDRDLISRPDRDCHGFPAAGCFSGKDKDIIAAYILPKKDDPGLSGNILFRYGRRNTGFRAVCRKSDFIFAAFFFGNDQIGISVDKEIVSSAVFSCQITHTQRIPIICAFMGIQRIFSKRLFLNILVETVDPVGKNLPDDIVCVGRCDKFYRIRNILCCFFFPGGIRLTFFGKFQGIQREAVCFGMYDSVRPLSDGIKLFRRQIACICVLSDVPNVGGKTFIESFL